MKVYLIGVGMGNPDLLTREAEWAIRSSDLLLSAERLLKEFSELNIPQKPLVKPGDIAAALADWKGEQVSILLSGDIGFYSGAKGLYPLLDGYEVVSLPGVSSLSYFCAKCRIPWQDVYTISCHGRDGGILPAVQSHGKTFALTGGAFRVEQLCRQLADAGLGNLTAWAGEWLSYPDERILRSTVEELAEQRFDDLAVLLVENPHPIQPEFQAPGLPDSAFQRGKVPMTKEEVRALAVSKLRLRNRDVVWDVGAGTGSVSVECALRLPEGRIYAVERKAEAVSLICQNRDKFHLSNLHLTEGEAPACLENLPAPDRVFVGGSGGQLRGIVAAALEKNADVRIVVSAVTLETLTAALDVMKEFHFQETEVVQVSVSKAAPVGGYRMMKAENPVYLISMEHPA
ncbi:MAG: precorrin-6y C5,15-methyltransferase (decarboxylating) subunit CbiE [Oscillospiraceae bacterium]|nr:precorrin-6y C5,15-methyltransferase (decarboxylating) subunit CbiE [Oscillospiraceae bacterium]